MNRKRVACVQVSVHVEVNKPDRAMLGNIHVKI